MNQNETERKHEKRTAMPVELQHVHPLVRAARAAGMDPNAVMGQIQTIHVAAGEMVVHHQDTWHGSGPNLSTTKQRRALVVHLINGQIRWRSRSRPHYIYGRYYIEGEDIPREDFFPFTFRRFETTNFR